jgi:hypothetical protein
MLEQRDAFSVELFASRHNISRSKVYGEIRAGRLIARKVGDRTIILAEDGRAWRENLPKVPATYSSMHRRSAKYPTAYGAHPKIIKRKCRLANPGETKELPLTSHTEEVAIDGGGASTEDAFSQASA